jgi:hypothetical protein
MNNLFICNTHYQLLISIQICRSKRTDNNSLILYNLNIDNKNVMKTQLLTLFDDVIFCEKLSLPKMKLLFSSIFGKCAKLEFFESAKVDNIYAFNFDHFAHCVFAILYKGNKRVQCHMFEEGILSYSTPFTYDNTLKLSYFARKVLFKRNMRNLINDFYCFEPSLYSQKFRTVKIEKIAKSDKWLKEFVSSIYPSASFSMYKTHKYIYIASVYDFEGSASVGELELLMALSEKIHKSSILIKPHPRDDLKRFTDCGFDIDTNLKIPWEALQIIFNFSDNVFLSSFSGSLLNSCLLFQQTTKSIYFPIIFDTSRNKLANYYKNVLLSFSNNTSDSFKSLFFIKDLNDFFLSIK